MSITVCDELGRATRCYVSAYQRDRVHSSSLNRGEVRCLVADFNGALPKGRTIASVIWRCAQGFPVVMSDAAIAGRATSIQIKAQFSGVGSFKCEATMDNGEVYTQPFRICVGSRWWGWFDAEPNPSQGPTVLTVSV